MRKLLLLLVVACASAFAGNTCAITLSANTTMSATTAGQWTSCGGVKPQNGDNISVTGGFTLTLNTPMTFGAGQAPYRGYPSAITGSAGGSTSCASPPSLGGTATRAGALGCQVVSGACAPYIADRGEYSAPGTTNIASACSGGSPTFAVTWQAGGGTPAILVDSNTTVLVSAAIVARGDVLGVDSYGDTSTAFRLTSGGSLTFDFSLSTNSPVYTLGMQGNAGSYGRTYDTDGTCTLATCAIKTSGGPGAWRIDYNYAGYNGAVNLRGVTLQNMGDASTWGIYWAGALYLFNNAVSSSSAINIGGGTSNGSIDDVEGNSWTASIPSNGELSTGAALAEFYINYSNSPAWDGTGIRTWTGNASDIPLLLSGGQNGIRVTGNFMRLSGISFGGSALWTSFSNNALVFTGSTSSNNLAIGGNLDHNLIWGVGVANNWHTEVNINNFTHSETYNVYGISSANAGDSGEIAPVAANSGTTTFANNWILPDAAGLSWSEPGGSPENITGHEIADHNYWYADYGNTPASFGFVDDDEVSVTPANYLTSMRCNSFWNSHAHANTYLKINDQLATPTTNPPGTANIDYNWGWGAAMTQPSCTGCTGQTGGYAAGWTGYTPGQHDQNSIDPGIDYTRRPETFPTEYLHYTASNGTWSSGATYAKGATVTDTQSGVYFGHTVAYICIASGGCVSGTATRPGSGSSWFSYWEPYVFTWLQNQVTAHSTYVDGALVALGAGEDTACTPGNPCDAITAIRHWIMAGLQHSNPQYFGACSDGTTIGPADVPRIRRGPLPVAMP